MEELKKTTDELLPLITAGDKAKAVDKILAFKSKGATRFDLIRTLISYAQQINNYAMARTALDAFERIKAKAPKDASLYYDIANGYQVLFELTIKGDYKKSFECQEIVENAIKYFQKSLGWSPRALTNFGNLYDTITRPIEAIDYYERAIKVDNNFGMALGNKAYALELIAPVSKYRQGYLLEAYHLYEEALKNEESIKENGSIAAVDFFRDRSGKIHEFFKQNGKEDLLAKDLSHKHYDESGMSPFVKFYTDFCVKHNLYLNLHRSNTAAEASISDSIFPTLYTGIQENDYVTDIAFRFNEISESYMTARMALVQSQYTNSDFSEISKQTTLVNNLDYSVSNIYVGHLKTAYKEVFSTLDKVAMLINHYLELGHPTDKVYYHNVWFAEQPKDSQEEPKLLQKIKDEPYLFGLYLLCQELRGSQYSHVRNALTHRYLRVYAAISGPKDTYMFEDLTDLTIEVFYKVRCAIIYLSLFIFRKEQSKHSNEKGKTVTMPLYTNQNLDLWGKV
jgi:tetratricopeptide (TPR) repeat protein